VTGFLIGVELSFHWTTLIQDTLGITGGLRISFCLLVYHGNRLFYSRTAKECNTDLQHIFLNTFLLGYTKNAYNQHGFSNVTYTTASLPRLMLTTKLPEMHFAMIGLDNKNLWVVGRLIF